MNSAAVVQLVVGWREWIVFGMDAGSSILGIVGTYYMAKRFEPTFWSAFKMALATLRLRLTGKSDSVDSNYDEEAQANKTVPESPSQTALGLNLLFLAFLLQFLKILFAHYVLLYP
jgi:hypothetical protein